MLQDILDDSLVLSNLLSTVVNFVYKVLGMGVGVQERSGFEKVNVRITVVQGDPGGQDGALVRRHGQTVSIPPLKIPTDTGMT